MQNSKNSNRIVLRQAFRLEELPILVKDHFIPLLKAPSIITLSGPLGAGKTTLIREMIKQLGAQVLVSSPTFGYVKHYQTTNGLKINHFDLYRIDSLNAFIANGFDEYLQRKNELTFIEWPAVIEPLLTCQTTAINQITIALELDSNNPQVRSITILISKK